MKGKKRKEKKRKEWGRANLSALDPEDECVRVAKWSSKSRPTLLAALGLQKFAVRSAGLLPRLQWPKTTGWDGSTFSLLERKVKKNSSDLKTRSTRPIERPRQKLWFWHVRRVTQSPSFFRWCWRPGVTSRRWRRESDKKKNEEAKREDETWLRETARHESRTRRDTVDWPGCPLRKPSNRTTRGDGVTRTRAKPMSARLMTVPWVLCQNPALKIASSAQMIPKRPKKVSMRNMMDWNKKKRYKNSARYVARLLVCQKNIPRFFFLLLRITYSSGTREIPRNLSKYGGYGIRFK